MSRAMSISPSISSASSRYLKVAGRQRSSSTASSRLSLGSNAGSDRTGLATMTATRSISSTGTAADSGSLTASILETSLAVLKEIAEAANNVPYVKAAAGIMLQIIKIKDEVDQCKDRWDEVMQSIAGVAQIICTANDLNKTFEKVPLPTDLVNILTWMERELREVFNVMNQCKTPTRKREKIKAVLNRSELLGKINKCDSRMKEIVNHSQTSIIFNIRYHQAVTDYKPRITVNVSQVQSSFEIPKVIRIPELVPPQIFFGRDKELAGIVDMIFKHPPARIAILGNGGIGKTALARAVLTDPRIVKAYHRVCYLVPCEASTSYGALLAGIALALGIVDQTDTLAQRILLHLEAAPCILCLDNFETPWDHQNPNDKRAAEDLLAQITSKPSVTLLITMRGKERPAGIAWTHMPVLRSPGPEAAKETWQKIVGTYDQWAAKLVEAVEYHPLAVTLLAGLAQSQSSESLWERWETDDDQAIKMLTSLDVSMQLTLKSPRMQSDPSAIKLLSILSALPDGMHTSLIYKLHDLFPDISNIMQSLRPLFQSGLAYESADKKIQIERLVRWFCKEHYPLSDSDQKILQQHYIQMAAGGYEAMSNAQYQEIKIELKNLEAILHQCLDISGHSEIKEEAIKATRAFTHFCIYIGVFSESLIKHATEQAKKFYHSSYADCLHTWASVDLAQDNLSNAEEKYNAALALHKNAEDIAGQANDICQLGEMHYRSDRLDDAQIHFEKSYELQEQVQNASGLANVSTHLANLYRRKGKDMLHKAEQLFLKALDLHRNMDDKMGQANDLKGLGSVLMRLDKLKEAKARYEEALALHEDVNDIVGQANDITYLGELHFRADEFEQAKHKYQQAFKLHKQVNDTLGQANDLNHLGNVLCKLHDFKDAESHYLEARDLHYKTKDNVGQANDLKGLANIHLKNNEKDKAIENYQNALRLFRKADNKLGQANCLAHLGRMYYRNGEYDKALPNFEEARQLHGDANDSIGQGNDLNDMADIKRQVKDYHTAEEFYHLALDLHEKAKDRLGQGNDYKGLGRLYYQKKDILKSREMYMKAVEMYQQSGRKRSEEDVQSILKRVNARIQTAEKVRRANAQLAQSP